MSDSPNPEAQAGESSIMCFLDPNFIRRIQKSKGEADLLRKALGKSGPLRILDATGGWCRDALRMAYWGHSVVACERDNHLGQLLLQNYRQAKAKDFYHPWIARLEIVVGSTEDFLRKNPQVFFDIVVIDTLFPNRKKSALPKKDLQKLRSILQDQKDNARDLLQFCWEFPWKTKPKKILLKRPLKAPPLELPRASQSYRGRSHRWDLFVPGFH